MTGSDFAKRAGMCATPCFIGILAKCRLLPPNGEDILNLQNWAETAETGDFSIKSMTGTGFEFHCRSLPPLPPLNVAESGSNPANVAESAATATAQPFFEHHRSTPELFTTAVNFAATQREFRNRQ